MAPRIEAEDYRNVEVRKIEGRGTVHRNPEEGKQALKEKENAWQQRIEHTAKLRALRLAKEAADKEKEDDG